jgi:hypothetical protein
MILLKNILRHFLVHKMLETKTLYMILFLKSRNLQKELILLKEYPNIFINLTKYF